MHSTSAAKHTTTPPLHQKSNVQNDSATPPAIERSRVAVEVPLDMPGVAVRKVEHELRVEMYKYLPHPSSALPRGGVEEQLHRWLLEQLHEARRVVDVGVFQSEHLCTSIETRP